MKKIVLVLSIASLLFSCNRMSEDQIKKLEAQRDSLSKSTESRDSSINQFLLAFNEIEGTLNDIKEKEKIVNVSAPGELSQSQKDQIQSDILEMYKRIKMYKSKISKMQKQFKSMNIKIGQMKKMIAHLEQTIKEKDAEIDALRIKLTGMNIVNDSLFRNIDALNAKNEKQEVVITEKTTKLNRAFFVIGSKKELIEKGILDKKGLLGKVELKSDINKEYFTQIDISKTSGIPVFSSKAQLFSVHPSKSYKMHIAGNQVDSIKITDPEEFWSVSKYCVIVVE
jgi:chromosome segregation ATPase